MQHNSFISYKKALGAKKEEYLEKWFLNPVLTRENWIELKLVWIALAFTRDSPGSICYPYYFKTIYQCDPLWNRFLQSLVETVGSILNCPKMQYLASRKWHQGVIIMAPFYTINQKFTIQDTRLHYATYKILYDTTKTILQGARYHVYPKVSGRGGEKKEEEKKL